MALVLANRVQETTTTTGTGTITLAGAVAGFQSFAVVGNGNTTYYTITSGSAWEVGIGTYSTAGPTLARTTILSSSAGGAAITLAGTSAVFVAYPADKSVNYDASGNVGIGTSSPAERLTVNSASSEFAIQWSGPGNEWVLASAANRSYIRNKTAGVETLTILNAGNVGIGTSSPAAKFQIDQNQAAISYLDYNNTTNGGGVVWRQIVRNIANSGTTSVDIAKLTGGAFLINNNDTNAANFTAFGVGASERMRIDSSGNVGIGTSAPGVTLDIAGDTLRLTRAANPPAFLGRQSQGTLAAPTATISGDQITAFGGFGYTGAAYTSTPASAMRFLALETFTSTANGSGISFETTPIGSTTSSRTERMRITSAGNVGIGTTAPGKTLDLVGQFRASGSAASGYALLEYGTSATATNNWHVGSEGDGTFRWYNGNFGAGTEKMRIDSSGNVTLANKIIPNVQSVASAATITPNANTDTQVSVTALAVPATLAAPSGTPSDGQSLVIRIEDNGTARALTWTTGSSGAYRAVGITLPTTTVATKVLYVGCKYNSTDLRWDAVALSQEA